ncbi:MAG: DUF4382 domain-containing protein, partial [Halovenus sp.]
MTDIQPSDTSHSKSEDSDGTLQRRKFLAASCGAGVTMFAGCASESGTDDDSPDGSSDGTGSEDGSDETETDSGSFRLLVSDMPADIGDFDRLDVSFDRARIFDGGGDSEDGETDSDDDAGETNETEQNATAAAQETDDGEQGDGVQDDSETEERSAENSSEEDPSDDESDEDSDGGAGRGGFYTLDLDGATVDLTQVVDDRAISVFDGELSEGRYTKIELYVADIEGVVDGEVAEVKVPSGKLQITQSFDVVAGEAVEFVFDINVVKRGQKL